MIAAISHCALAYSAISPKAPSRIWEIAKSVFLYLSLPKARAAPITLISPLPDLKATPGTPLTLNINLLATYQLANSNSNLELSITGSPAWLSLNMGPFSVLNTCDLNGYANAVTVNGNYAYAALNNALTIVDISNPLNPVIVGARGNTYAADNGYFIDLRGNYAFYGIANFPVLHRIDVLDVSTPSNMALKSEFMIDYDWNTLMSGNYVYTTFQYNGLTIIDYNNLTKPYIKSSLPISGSSLHVSGNYSFVGNTNKIFVANVANPSSPTLAATINNFQGNVRAMLLLDPYLLTAIDYNLVIFDLSQLTNPTIITKNYLGYTCNQLFNSGKYLFVPCGPLGVILLDIEDIANPEIIYSFVPQEGITSGILRHNTLYVPGGQAGLLTIDAAQRVLSGTPAAADWGLLHLNVTAADELGNQVIDPIVIHVGDIRVAVPIPNQQVFCTNSAQLTFSSGTFEYPGASFTYRAGLMGGAPLPSFISFTPASRTFIFRPQTGDQNTYLIELTADDGYGGLKSLTFELAIPNRPPQMLVQPIFGEFIAFTGTPYRSSFRRFGDIDHDPLSYSAQGMPGWLNIDQALFQFYGTPFGKGDFPVLFIAADGHGGTVTESIIFTVPNTAPIVLNPLGTLLSRADIPFSYTFPADTFYDVDNDPLTYTTGQLPDFLTFDPVARRFSGTPRPGSYAITLTANDTSGATVSDVLTLNELAPSSNNPPVLVKSIPDVSKSAGVPFSFTFDANTFEDPEGGALTYQATLEGGAPLPPGLNFDSATRTLSGKVEDPQTLRISIRATDPMEAFTIDTFTLNILNHGLPPIVLNPLPNAAATVGAPFYYLIPNNTFADMSGDPLTISLNQAGGKPLPQWLKWDPATLSLSGKPGPWDTDTYHDRLIEMEVWAADTVGSVKTSCKITVQGDSFWATFIKAGITVGSIAASGYGLIKSRALIWNYFRKERYRQKAPVRAIAGEEFEKPLRLQYREVKEVRAYFNGKPLYALPDDLVYAEDRIKGKPARPGCYTIRVIDHGGYINEEFDLVISNSESMLAHLLSN